jgi:pimeloyl-ACP methyl ester carboxylesterase
VSRLLHDGIALAYDDLGAGEPALLFIHGIGGDRSFWTSQLRHFAPRHRVLAVDLRGHGDSDAPEQRYTIRAFADDVAWMCDELGLDRPVAIGHSLGGLVALELATADPPRVWAAVLIDSVLLPAQDRPDAVGRLVAGLRGGNPERTLHKYFATLFGPNDDPSHRAWLIERATRTPPHVMASVWEQSIAEWNDADALRRCGVPLAYLDAGTPNADLVHAVELCPRLMVGRTIGSGHFSPLEVPDQINAMTERFLSVTVGH